MAQRESVERGNNLKQSKQSRSEYLTTAKFTKANGHECVAGAPAWVRGLEIPFHQLQGKSVSGDPGCIICTSQGVIFWVPESKILLCESSLLIWTSRGHDLSK